MNPIEGLELSTIAVEAKEAWLRAEKERIIKQINGIYLNIRTWQARIDEFSKGIADMSGKISKANEKLQQINGGNWGMIQDDKKDETA